MSGDSSRRPARALLVVACLLVGALVAGQEAPPGPVAEDVIAGRVTDQQNRPIPGALVSAWADGANELRDPAMVNGVTDADGRFRLQVPFPKVRYQVWVRRAGYRDQTPHVIAGQVGSLEVSLDPTKTHVLTGLVADGATGRPAADARVTLISEYSGRWERKTDEAGRFSIDDVPDYIGQGVMIAEAGGLVSPIRMVYGDDRDVVLPLGAPARLSGVVVEDLTGMPLVGGVVTLRPSYASAFSIETMSGLDGRVFFLDVPPGEYGVDVSHPEYFLPPIRSAPDRRQIPLNAGQTGYLSFPMVPVATVSGRVVGPDGRAVTDAVVGLGGAGGIEPGKRWRTVRTDDRGDFTVSTGWFDEPRLVAFSASAGHGKLSLRKLTSGEDRRAVTVELSGIVRMAGTVKDDAGKPVASVSVQYGSGSSQTDVEGRFDLGRVPLAREGKAAGKVTFRAPRPHTGDLHLWRDDGSRQPAKLPEPHERFFQHKQLVLDAKPGDQVDLQVTLEPAALLTFSGRVLAADGKPVSAGSVILFAGKADWERLKRELRPMDYTLDSFAPRMTGWPLCRTETDREGRWTIQVVRESAEGLKLASYGTADDPSRFSVGAEGPEGAMQLVEDVVLAEGQTTRQVDITLEEAPVVVKVSGTVVDDAGKPLAGIVVQTFRPVRRVTTGADGTFVIRRDAEWVSVRAPGWALRTPRGMDAGRESQFELQQALAGNGDLRIVLGRNGAVSGTVRWASGKPVTSFSMGRATFVGPEGTFRLGDVSPGTLSLHLKTPEGVTGQARGELAPAGETSVDVILPDPTVTVSGRVSDGAGNFLADVKVSLSGQDFDAEMLTDPAGGFSFLVPVGAYQLSARSVHHSARERIFDVTRIAVTGDEKSVEADVIQKKQDGR